MTLHDYWAVCPRVQMVRPDLTMCAGPDPAGTACAACDAAGAALSNGRRPSLKFMDPQAMTPEIRERVTAKLHLNEVNVLARHPVRTARYLRYPAAMERALKRLDVIISPTRFLSETVKKYLDLDISVIPHGIELPRKRTASRCADRIAFGYLGALNWHKGVHILVKAFSRLKGNASLQVWGGTEDESYKKYLAALDGSGRVDFRGAFENGRIDDILQGIDVLVVPSLWHENYPLVVREALACGVGLMASDTPALREAAAEAPGTVFFDPRDEGDLYRRMQMLVDDPEKRRAISADMKPVKGMKEHLQELLSVYQGMMKADG